MTLPRLLFILLACGIALGGCRRFPEIEVSEQKFDKSSPYPEFVPLDILLKEPEPEIDAEMEKDLTKRGQTLANTETAQTVQDTQDPLLDRLDALRKKRQENATTSDVIEDDLRKRMEQGITAPAVPE